MGGFLLCTTEAHKIPTTIASRCQQFSFRSVEFGEVLGRLRWICEQEGIAADDEALAVLTQAGEGSVRDSLSALDQAIACFGEKLQGPEVRSLLGMFSVESMGQVSEALTQGDAARMLEIVGELERNGRNLQHFCRELSRYFRNLLVARIAGSESRLIAATDEEKARLGSIAAGFSQEDLSRYLHLTLDLFRQLQYSLQPRLHLELGLVRLVYAGKLTAIEDVLASMGGAPAPATGTPSSGNRPRSAPASTPRSSSPAAEAEGPRGELETALVRTPAAKSEDLQRRRGGAFRDRAGRERIEIHRPE